MMRLRALTFFAVALVAASVQAMNPAQDPKEVLTELKNIDCKIQGKECKYLAAVEAVAFLDSCPTAFVRKFNVTVRPDELKTIQEVVQGWTELRDPELKAAVLNPDNKLRRHLAASLLEYLSGLPSDDLGIECSRLGAIKEGEPAENMSEILRGTKNFKAFEDERRPAMPKPAAD